MKFRRVIPAVASSLAMAIALNAQAQTAGDPVRDVQDLVGARAGQAEGEVRRRGYTYRRNERISNTSVASFWVEGNSGKCVEIVTSNGRFQNIFYAEWHHCAN